MVMKETMTCKCPKFDGCDMAKNWSISDPECGACTVAIASVSYVSKHLPLDDKWLWYISENLLTQASESLAKFDTFSGVTSSGCFENVLFSCNRSIQSPCIYKPTTAFKAIQWSNSCTPFSVSCWRLRAITHEIRIPCPKP